MADRLRAVAYWLLVAAWCLWGLLLAAWEWAAGDEARE
jgi:hypothetical protein